MRPCDPHECNDPDPQRARRSAPAAQISGGAGRHVAVRLPARRAAAIGRTADAGGVPRALEGAARGFPFHFARRGDPRRTRPRMIVVDASVVVDVLMATPEAAAVDLRL